MVWETFMRDFLIFLVCNLLENGKSLSEIHDRLLDAGATEETAYLCFQAGKLLLQERVESEKRVRPPFGRK